MENDKKKLLIITCGTAGHILPALTLVEDGLRIGLDVTLIIDGISAIAYQKRIEALTNNYQLKVFYNKPFKSFKTLFAGKFWQDWYKCTYIIRCSTEIVTFICGLQIHLLLSAILLRRKQLFLHEQDSILNKTNRIGQLFTKNINSSFRNIKYAKKPRWIGCPIKQKEAITSSEKKIITILAGTNGAQLFDIHIPLIFAKLKHKYPKLSEYTIYHNCKKYNLEMVNTCYQKYNFNYQVSDYFQNFEELIRDSSFLITRGGASTISYLAKYKKNSIIIPWANSSQGHQLQNAQELVNAQATILVEEKEINNLEQSILHLLENQDINMGKSIKENFKIISGKEYLKLLT